MNPLHQPYYQCTTKYTANALAIYNQYTTNEPPTYHQLHYQYTTNALPNSQSTIKEIRHR